MNTKKIHDQPMKKAGKVRQSQPMDFMDRTPGEVIENHPESFVAEAIKRGIKKNKAMGK